jgi:hypothetical protein
MLLVREERRRQQLLPAPMREETSQDSLRVSTPTREETCQGLRQ